jgi:hypothetical protein
LAQVSAENLIRLTKQIRRARKLLGEIASHPDALRALTCEKQCDFLWHTWNTVSKLALARERKFRGSGRSGDLHERVLAIAKSS